MTINERVSPETLDKIIEAADEVITALAGTNEDVHKNDSAKMCQLWDDLNDRYATPAIVKAMARELQQYRAAAEPVCPKCGGTGMADSGGFQPWGEPILIECDCQAAPQVTSVPIIPERLHPATADLVLRFASALAQKLLHAEQKYGYSDNWQKSDWSGDCLQSLREHVDKGDPRDVAAYCAFMWHHGWSTAAPAVQAEQLSGNTEQVSQPTLPADYLQGHKDGCEWSALMAEANHPQTGDWLFDDPIELAKAIRKGPDMLPAPHKQDFREIPNSSTNNCRENADSSTKCWCHTCRPVTMTDMRFVVCPDCGNKRCPHANDHRNACTGSNEPGQEGSAYPAAPKQEAE